MVLETKRLILRPWRMDDAESLYKYASDPRVGPAAGWKTHESIGDSLDVLEKILMRDGTFAITVRERGDEPVGSFGYFRSRSDESELDEMELGYWIGVPFWGQGYVPEAVRGVLAHLFSTTDARRIWCGHFEGNDKSRRVIEKCGFTFMHKREIFWTPMQENRVNYAYTISREEFERSGAEK